MNITNCYGFKLTLNQFTFESFDLDDFLIFSTRHKSNPKFDEDNE
jgi:hypothetical protein